MQPSLADISEKIFVKKPVLKDILQKYGTETLLEYSRRFPGGSAGILAERKKEFIDSVASEVSRVLGPDAGERARLGLVDSYFVSTADHLGPLSHPFFLHTNMLAGMGNMLPAPNQLSEWIVLACSNVSLNNSSYPRGLQFHSQKTGSPELCSFSFFPTALRHASVYNLPAYGEEKAKKLYNYLHGRLSGTAVRQEIENICQLYGQQDVLNLPSFSDQVTLTNYRLFKLFFPDSLGPLNLIYLNQEKLTVELLKYHLHELTDIHRLLFEAECRGLVADLFEGIPGAFSLKQSKGTFLFWGYDGQKRLRIRLIDQNGVLVSPDKKFSVHIDPESIYEALQKGTLIPSMLLNMLVVGGYYGVKCLGGFSQTSYLTWMLEAYKKIFPKAMVGDSQTLCGDFIFADILLGQKHAFAATGLDMLLYKKQFNFEAFAELCKTKTLNEVMQRVFPILFKILYPHEPEYRWPKESYGPDFSISPNHSYPVIKL